MAKTFRWSSDKKPRQHTIPEREHRQNLRRALSKPGKAPLTPAQKRARTPVVPGSALTNRGLRRETRAAARLQFGPVEQAQRQQLGEAQNYQRDIAGYYDDYLQRIARQAANVRTLGDQASQQIQGLQAGVTGLAGADLQGLQGAANQDAAARGATAGDLTGMASNAAAVRQALVGSFGAQQASANNAAARYADLHANVVAPGQKLQAVAGAAGRVRQIGEKRAETAAEKGAFKTKYRGERIGEEAKNALALQIAGGKEADAAFERRQTRREFAEEKRSTRADERLAGQRISSQEKMAADRLAAQRRAAAQKAKAKPQTPVLSPKDRGQGMTQLTTLKSLLEKARDGKPFIDAHKGHGKFAPRDRAAGEKKVREYAPVAAGLKHPILLTAASEVVYGGGYLTSQTMKALRAAGYDPKEVVRTLSGRSPKQLKQAHRRPT